MGLKISKSVQTKLRDKHGVSVREVKQCFANREHGDLIDTREDHKTNPPTRWFLSVTDNGRYLKIIYIVESGSKFILKSAYEPEPEATAIYNNKFGL